METNIKNLKINYNVWGEGKDILILHGWGANIETVMPIVRAFEKKFKVWAVDLPGFGKSDLPQENWNVYSYADFVRDFIQKLKIENPTLIGHSFGGRLSIILAAKKMININKIILVDSAGVLPKRSAGYYFKVYTYKFMKKCAKIVGRVSKATEEKIKNKFGSADYKNADPTMRSVMVKVVNEDLTYLMQKINNPTLLIWGENDDATPVSDAKIMEKLMQDAGLVILKGAGHYSYIDKYEEFNVIANKFLENDAR